MWHNAHDAYLESRILSASSIELVRVLYRGSMEAVQNARRHLANRQVRERARAISRASEFLLELTSSLDHVRGGEISQRLAALYQYMLGRLTQANFEQSDAPLEEVLGLLATLLEAWEGISVAEAPAGPMVAAWGPPVPQESVTAPSARAWSF